MNRQIIFVWIFIIAWVFSPIVRATDIPVAADAPDGVDSDTQCSLREAISNANFDVVAFEDCPAGEGDDVILLEADGVYNLTATGSEENGNLTGDLDITNNLTITTNGGMATIDASPLSVMGEPDRIIEIGGIGLTLTFENLILQGGELISDDGATVYGAGINLGGGATATITNCDFLDTLVTLQDDSTAFVLGGVIYSGSGTNLTITDSLFQGNAIEAEAASASIMVGGVLYGGDSDFSITNTIFTENTIAADPASTATLIGGVFFAGNFSSVTVDHVEISNSTITVAGAIGGGGLFRLDGNDNTSTVNISDSQFTDNSVTTNTATETFGGMIQVQSTDVSLTSSLFANNEFIKNTSGNIYGAVLHYVANSATALDFTMLNTTITGNSASNEGGNITGTLQIQGTTPIASISFSTIANNNLGAENTEVARGGGLYYNGFGGTLTLKSSVLFGNGVMATTVAEGVDCYAEGFAPLSDDFNFITDTAECQYTPADSDQIGVDPLLGVLADKGGPTEVLPLDEVSPARNLDPDCEDALGNTVTTDQRGAPRSDGECDSGANEYGLFYTDADADGFGAGASTDIFTANQATENGDCADMNADINPDAIDICDEIDNNCDMNTDEDFADLDDACTVGVGACENTGVVVCSDDGSATECDATADEPVTELCGDDIDNNCDGDTDEGFENEGEACSVGLGACTDTGTYECSDDNSTLACNATAGDSSTEICDDETDNDCDGTTDTDDANCADAGDDDTDGDATGDDDTTDEPSSGGCALNNSPTATTTQSVIAVMAFVSLICIRGRRQRQ